LIWGEYLKKLISNVLILLVTAGLITGGILLKPLHRPVGLTLLINSDDDFRRFNCRGSGTPEDPYIIKNLVFGVNETFVKRWYYGLEVINTNSFFVVRDCIFFGGLHAIRIANVARGTANISHNKFYGRQQAEADNILGGSGIEIDNSEGIIIAHNLFTKATKSGGGNLYITNSKNIFLENNEFEDYVVLIENSLNVSLTKNLSGADFLCDIWNSENISITENSCFNSGSSIYLWYSSNILIDNNSIKTTRSSQGIILMNCSYISVKWNNITKPFYDSSMSGRGIILQNSQFSIIEFNIIKYYARYAIAIFENSNNNTIFSNMFYNNKGAQNDVSQGYDEGFGNLWFNPSLLVGNYWNDLGSNTTYEIAGPAGSVDLYPLSSPP